MVSASLAYADTPAPRPAFVAPPAAGEDRLTGAEAFALASDGAIECDDYRPSSNDCSAISRTRVTDNGEVWSDGILLASRAPHIELLVSGRVTIHDDALCFDIGSTRISVPPSEDLDEARAKEFERLVEESFKQEDFKAVCATYAREGDRIRTRSFSLKRNGKAEELDPGVPSYTRFFRKDETVPPLRPIDEEVEHRT